MKMKLLAIGLTVALCGSASSQDPGMHVLRECIAVGLKASIPAAQYQQMLGRIATLPRALMIEAWTKEYGRNNLSTFVAYNEPYERRVFALDYLASPPEIAQSLFGNASRNRHVCDESDIGTITINNLGEDRGVISGQVTIERPLVYRVLCCFVATRKQPDGAWRLEFIGVDNRLSSDIRVSRPVFVHGDRWDEIDFQLRALGIPTSPFQKKSPSDQPSVLTQADTSTPLPTQPPSVPDPQPTQPPQVQTATQRKQ